MTVKTRRILKFSAVWLITIAIFAVLFSKIKLSDVVEALKQADITLFVLSLVVSAAAHIAITIPRYRFMLRILGCRMSFSETLILRMGTLPIKNVTPFKAGELSRAAYLKNKHGFPYTRGVVSIVMGYALSFISLASCALVGLALVVAVPWQKIGAWLLFALFWALVFLGGSPLVSRLVKVFLKLLKLPESEFRVCRKLLLPFPLSVLLGYSLAFEGCQLLNTWLLLKALGASVSVETFLLFGPLSILIAVLPVTVFGLGTRESAIVYFFSRFASQDRLLAASFLTTFANRLLPIFLGLFFVKPFLDRLVKVREGAVKEEE